MKELIEKLVRLRADALGAEARARDAEQLYTETKSAADAAARAYRAALSEFHDAIDAQAAFAPRTCQDGTP